MSRGNSWPVARLDSCATLFDSLHKTPKYADQGFPMVRVTDIRGGYLNTEGTRKVDAETHHEFSKKHPPVPGDVLYSRVGSYGNSVFVKREEQICIGQNTVCLAPDRTRVDPFFFFSSLYAPAVVAQVEGMVGGSSQPTISLKNIASLRLLLPPLPTQRRIASILSAYDDLIENNTKRIEILEEMARSLYREWFVHFRFPDHEKVKLVDSELGKIPEGWEVVSATDVIVFNPRVKVDKSRENFFVPMTSLATGSMLIGDVERKLGNSGSKFMNGDTLFARITPCLENGKTGYVQFLPTSTDVACGSTEFIVLREGRFCREMVYALSRTDSFRQHAINSMSGASGRQRAKEQAFEAYRLACPGGDLIAKYGEIVGPMFSLLEKLNQKNRTLRQTRDLLLPKLISGEIDVDALDLSEAS